MSTIIRPSDVVRVNTDAAYAQSHPSVAASIDGYAVVWRNQLPDGTYETRMKQYDLNGEQIGNEISLGDEGRIASIAALADGTYRVVNGANVDVAGLVAGGSVVVSVYSDPYHGGSYSGTGVFVQRYDSTGSPLGGLTLVNETTANDQDVPVVTALADGGYVIAWQSQNQDGSGLGIYARQYDAAGIAVTGEMLVNTITAGNQRMGDVTALSGGGYVVTWWQGGGGSVHTQVFGSDGEKLGSETSINGGFSPSIAGLSDGGYVLAWSTSRDTRTPGDVLVQQFDATGAAVSLIISIGADTYVAQVSVAALPDNRFIVTWTNGNDVFSRTLGSDTSSVMTGAEEYVTGTAGNDTLAADPGALGAGDIVDGLGGFDTVALNAAGTLDIRAPKTFVNIQGLAGSGGSDTFIVNAGRLAGIKSIDGKGGTDTIKVGVSASLAAISLSSIEAVELFHAGTQITLKAAQASALSSLTSLSGGILQAASGGVYDLSAVAVSGFSRFLGSSGSDMLVLRPSQAAAFSEISGGAGADTLRMGAAGTLDLTALAAFKSVETVKGSVGNDRIVANAVALSDVTEINGSSGDDTLALTAGVSLVGKTLTSIEHIAGAASRIYTLDPINLAGVRTLDGGGGSVLVLDASATGTPITLTFGGGTGPQGNIGGTAVSGFNRGTIHGGSGADTLTGGAAAGSDLHGGGGADVLKLGTGGGSLGGDAGADTLISLVGSAKRVTLDGGAGIDLAIIDRSASGRSLALDLGDPSIKTNLGDGTSLINIERIEFTAGSGNDKLTGGKYADMLDGGAGVDQLSGGAGDDIYVVDDARDQIIESAGAGHDTVRSSVSYTLSVYVEDLTLTGSGNTKATGNAASNVLVGNSGNNILSGGGGQDKLTGGLGADTFAFKALTDSAAGQDRRDSITDFSHGQGDRIDLHLIDANTATAGDQAFTFLGTGAFTKHAGELHQVSVDGGTLLEGDVNGDGSADFQILLKAGLTLQASDFVL